MVIAALFPVGEMWKQSKCSLVGKQIKIIHKIYLLHTHGHNEMFLNLKKEFCHMLHRRWALMILCQVK